MFRMLWKISRSCLIDSSFSSLHDILLYSYQVFKIQLQVLLIYLRGTKDLLINSDDKKYVIKKSIESAYMKIMINYIQIVTICNSLKINWDSLLTKFYSVQNSVGGNIFKIVSLNCLLKGRKFLHKYSNFFIYRKQ